MEALASPPCWFNNKTKEVHMSEIRNDIIDDEFSRRATRVLRAASSPPAAAPLLRRLGAQYRANPAACGFIRHYLAGEEGGAGVAWAKAHYGTRLYPDANVRVQLVRNIERPEVSTYLVVLPPDRDAILRARLPEGEAA